MELSFELPGTPEQVWQAIATAGGISSWFLPTDLEERLGGAICTHMGETDSPGTVTGWEPPQRFAYEEPDWAGLAGHADDEVTPLATEFLVEAKSGGTCVVRVVSSAFGSGADWEQEFFESMERGWAPFFDRLRLYLSHFPGQQATQLSTDLSVASPPEVVLAVMRDDFGIEAVGQRVVHRGISGQVERIGQDDVLLRLTDPMPGYFGFAAFANGDAGSVAMVSGHLFSDEAPAFVEREEAGWKSWLESLDFKSTSTTSKAP
jgi:uncharacterized protein YndB with AHSA1/START domain